MEGRGTALRIIATVQGAEEIFFVADIVLTQFAPKRFACFDYGVIY
jgi:hypothetical protein